MNTETKTSSNINIQTNTSDKVYISVKTKFIVGHMCAAIWACLSIYLSMPWLEDLRQIVGLPFAIFLIAGLAYVPGYLNAILVVSLLLDKQPSFKNVNPTEKVTILIAARNEENAIMDTLKYIAGQDYDGDIKVIVIDNGSTDRTKENARAASIKYSLNVEVITESNPGKYNALNSGIEHVNTDLVITLDADTLLHKSAVRYIVSRIESSPDDVCAVAGTVLARNTRENLIAKIQEWDYFLSIASIKRYQGLYQGTLVAQGAYSIYKAKVIKEVNGWPDAIGEDIVLTWNMLKLGYKVYFEPLAVAFTDVPNNLKHLARQRSRWARGMIEALKLVKPWQQPLIYCKYLTSVNLVMPYLDIVYTFFWIPGLILAFFGVYYIVGPMTLFVLPLTFLSYYILYRYQRYVFKSLNLRIRDNTLGLIIFILFYQIIMSPVSVYGYFQEVFKMERIWK